MVTLIQMKKGEFRMNCRIFKSNPTNEQSLYQSAKRTTMIGIFKFCLNFVLFQIKYKTIATSSGPSMSFVSFSGMIQW